MCSSDLQVQACRQQEFLIQPRCQGNQNKNGESMGHPSEDGEKGTHLGFQSDILHDMGTRHAPGTTCLTTLSKSAPETGLTSQPVAPMRLPSSRLAESLSVVSVKIGTNR